MSSRKIFLLLALALSLSAQAAQRVALINGEIYTANDKQPWAEALVYESDTILYLGDEQSAQAFITPATQVHDLKGKLVTPGMHDMHMHAETASVFVHSCNLYALRSKQAIIAKLKECVQQYPDTPWLRGEGWVSYDENQVVYKEDLDKVLPDRPMWLMAMDGHSALVNSKALALSGISASTPDPVAGTIHKNGKGEPSGLLVESAMWIPEKLMPRVSLVDQVKSLAKAMQLANQYGITSIVEAWETPSLDTAWLQLKDEGRLTTRVNLALLVEEDWDENIELLKQRRAALDFYPLLKANQIKLLTDGIVEIKTAAVKEPYLGTNDDKGMFYFTQEQLNKWIPLLEGEGFQIHAHTIGDRAMANVLTALERSRAVNKRGNNQPMFIHNYLVDKADVPRLKEASASANFSMLWRQYDISAQSYKPFISQQNFERIMPMAELHEAGVLVTGGSDFYVSQIDPLAAITAAVTGKAVPYYRSWPYQPDSQPVMPGKKPDLDTMMKAYTIFAAQAQGMEDITGSLEKGKRADLVVFDKNFFKDVPEYIYGTQVLTTVFDGNIVYGSF
ncbi:amidohydrolase family protein [Dasania marina]|uniref:amidohydrolase n=1 Tax=Dasania marina TaxID=471499 RepID=UPI0030D834AD|tara:strand:+ start:81460 stop:83145 length:1686 start_codon:yes stop_codon:yes gene_type:complete